MTHRGPFQPRPFCDSVILLLCLVAAIHGGQNHGGQKKVLLVIAAAEGFCYTLSFSRHPRVSLGLFVRLQFHHFLDALYSVINPSRHVSLWSQLEMLSLFYC